MMFDCQISDADLKGNVTSYLQDVTRNHRTVLVTQPNGENAVILSQQEYASLVETVHLMRSPANARRLIEALEWSDRDLGEAQTLEELREEIERESQEGRAAS